jgi:hypothetical protein
MDFGALIKHPMMWEAMDLRKNWVFIYWLVLLALSISTFIVDYPSNFRYFTLLSNLGVLLWLVCAVFCYKRQNIGWKFKGLFRGAVTLYITVTFLVFSTLLSSGTLTYDSLMFHYIIPIAFIFEWTFSESSKQYQWRYLGVWIIFPLIYLAYAVINGQLTGFYPYFFLDLPTLGIGIFVAWVAFMVALFIGLGIVYIAINRQFYKRRVNGGNSN